MRSLYSLNQTPSRQFVQKRRFENPSLLLGNIISGFARLSQPLLSLSHNLKLGNLGVFS